MEKLNLFTIYDHPLDHPEHFVVRRFELDQPTPDVRFAKTLEDARALLPPGLVRMTREPEDDPKIVETWL